MLGGGLGRRLRRRLERGIGEFKVFQLFSLKKISNDVRFARRCVESRKYVLEQMLKEIKEELGVEVDEKKEDVERLEKKLNEFKDVLGEDSEIVRKGERELGKLRNIRIGESTH